MWTRLALCSGAAVDRRFGVLRSHVAPSTQEKGDGEGGRELRGTAVFGDQIHSALLQDAQEVSSLPLRWSLM